MLEKSGASKLFGLFVILYLLFLGIRGFLTGYYTVRRSEIFLLVSLLFILNSFLYKNKKLYFNNIILLVMSYFSLFYTWFLTRSSININEINSFVAFTAGICNFALLTLALNNNLKFKYITGSILTVIILMPVFIIWSYYSITERWLTDTAVLAILQTNGGETLAYIRDYFNFKVYFLILVMAVITAIIIKKFSFVKFNEILVKNKKLKIFMIIAFLSNLFIIYKGTDNFVLNIALKAKNSLQKYTEFEQNKLARKQNIIGLTNLQQTNNRGIYVLVIGESQNKTHMSAYGYQRNTTPWLDNMHKDKNFILFNNAYSCHTHTVPVLTYALTAKNQYNALQLANSPSLLETAEAAGYNTVWLSNQVKYGMYDTPITVIASEADQQIWLNGNLGETTNTDFYDEKLAAALQDIQLKQKMLIIIHLMGNHGSYSDRYPKEFIKYTDNNISDQYDNSIVYNDFVVKQIYDKVKSLPDFQAMVYFADHSEDVRENGHGHNADNYLPEMTYIPMYMYFSDNYIRNNKEQFEVLKQRGNMYFTNDLIFNTMLSIMNIKIPNLYESSNDLLSKDYDGNSARFKTLYGEKNIEGESKK